MQTFSYEAVDSAGQRQKGSCQAADKEAAARFCQQRGLYIISLQAGSDRRVRRLSDADRLWLFRRLAMLLDSGITLKDGLQSCRREGAAILNSALTGIIGALEGGSSLAAAMEAEAFPALCCAAVKSGELGGCLVEVLAGLADRLESSLELKRQFSQAMVYPCIVGSISLLGFGVILNIVVPIFGDVFRQLGGELPPLLKGLLNVRSFVAAWFIWLVPLLTVLAVSLVQALRRGWLDGWLLHLPFVGGYLLRRELVLMAGMGSLLLKSGLPLSSVLEQQAAGSSNRRLALVWLKVKDKIIGGSSLEQALRDTGELPELFIRFAALGEVSGRLDEMLARAAAYYGRELTEQTVWLSRIIEPVLLLAAGGIVLLLVLALLLPGFSLMDKIIL